MTAKKKKPPLHEGICARLVELHKEVAQFKYAQMSVLPPAFVSLEKEAAQLLELLEECHVPFSAREMVTNALIADGLDNLFDWMDDTALDLTLESIFSDAEEEKEAP